ncbi:hypothetical protein QN239_32105 [Mycolicibacterium sp. Y3]
MTLPDGGRIKLHVDPVKGGDINFPTPPPPAEPAEAATQAAEVPESGSAASATPKAPVLEPAAPKPPVAEAPVVEGLPVLGEGGPGALLGPELVHLPGSIDHPFPILGEGDLSESIRDFEGHG